MVSRVERSLFYFAIVNVGGFTYLWERLVNVCNLFKTKNLFIGRCNKMALNSLTLFSSTDELMHGQRGGGGKDKNQRPLILELFGLRSIA